LLFSAEPKDSIKDLFDRRVEVERFKDALNQRMVLVLGVRRVGKSSLVLSTLNSLNVNYIFIDVRRIYDNVAKKVQAERLYEELYLGLLRLSRRERVRDALARSGISLEYPIKVKLPVEEIRSNILRILDGLNELGRVIIVFDEAQYLRYLTIGLRPILAHVYDYMRGITMVFTGSEVGLLYDFIGVEDPGSELYGRYYESIELRPFSVEESKEFLRAGFKELGVSVEEYVIDRAVSELDGIVGWLVYFGRLYVEKGMDALDEVKALGVRMVKRELDEVFARSPYYRYIMKAIATLGKARWRNIMDYVMAQTGRRLTNATISRDLKNLAKMGFIERQGDEYRIIDPMVRYAMLEEY
jgi:AAA+ ATPase superfamily predicted ATPase